MDKLKVLIADDQKEFRDATISWFMQQPLNDYFEQYIECKYIKESVSNEICFDQLLNGLIQLDIAFIDLLWYEDGFENSFKGGEYITEKINDKFPGCLIIPVTQFRFGMEENTPPWEPKYGNKKYKVLPKDDTNEGKTKKFLLYLEEWLISEIKKIRDIRQLINILRGIESGNKSDYMVEFNGSSRLVSSFILPETNFGNRLYFKEVEMANEIKKLISYPKNKLWGRYNTWGKHTEVYFKSLELDAMVNYRKLNQIEKRAIYYISNLIEILKAKALKGNNSQVVTQIVNKAKEDKLICHQCNLKRINKIDAILDIKNIPEEYFDNLLIRYIIIGICTISDKTNNPEWKDKYTLVSLFDHSTAENTIKAFFYFSGFGLYRNSISLSSYSTDIFYKEREFITSEEFKSIQV